ncbi:YtxH domain-containing protein [Hazenella coriacea]|uniref:Uncharacterized protein n=1 Tax=Hazenella coriacea TaxID=1179467 RepID=A0A4R3L4B0_9BACL|nr:YtxH domain-containing protein [Hazenella coriacea]TCS93798.1 hypothetical protein EDD58_1055 [Hazenella coriacea]
MQRAVQWPRFRQRNKGSSTMEYIIIIAAAVILVSLLYMTIGSESTNQIITKKVENSLNGEVTIQPGSGGTPSSTDGDLVMNPPGQPASGDPSSKTDPGPAPNNGWEPYDNKYKEPNLGKRIRKAAQDVGIKYFFAHQKGQRLVPKYNANGKLTGYHVTGQITNALEKKAANLKPVKGSPGQFVRDLPVKNHFNSFMPALKHTLASSLKSGAISGLLTATLEGHENWKDWSSSAIVETGLAAATTAAGSAIGSAAAGFLASTAAGAALGSSVPLVGTVIGAVAGVGLYALTNTAAGIAIKNAVKSGVKKLIHAVVPDGVSDKIQSVYSSVKDKAGAVKDKVSNAVSKGVGKVKNFVGGWFK